MEYFFTGLWFLLWNPVTYVISVIFAIWGIAYFHGPDQKYWGRTIPTWIIGLVCYAHVIVFAVFVISAIGGLVGNFPADEGTAPREF